ARAGPTDTGARAAAATSPTATVPRVFFAIPRPARPRAGNLGMKPINGWYRRRTTSCITLSSIRNRQVPSCLAGRLQTVRLGADRLLAHTDFPSRQRDARIG